MAIIKERFTHRTLDSYDRPQRLYEYFVTGSGEFPFDMLRFDSCWPARGEDASLMHFNHGDREARKTRSIKIWSHCAPTIERWSSFCWSVGTENLMRKTLLED